MKSTSKKIGDFLKKIYGYGILASLFIGGATALVFLAAILIGGNTAASMCDFIYKKFITWLIIATDIVVLIGLVSMYFHGERAMALENKDLGE